MKYEDKTVLKYPQRQKRIIGKNVYNINPPSNNSLSYKCRGAQAQFFSSFLALLISFLSILKEYIICSINPII